MEEIYYQQACFDAETFTFIIIDSSLEEINFSKTFKLIIKQDYYLENFNLIIIVDSFYYFY